MVWAGGGGGDTCTTSPPWFEVSDKPPLRNIHLFFVFLLFASHAVAGGAKENTSTAVLLKDIHSRIEENPFGNPAPSPPVPPRRS